MTAAGVGLKVVQYLLTQGSQPPAVTARLQQVLHTKSEQPTVGSQTACAGVGTGATSDKFHVLLPAGQSAGTVHAVHVLLPSAQNAPAGQTASDELLAQ